MPTSRSMSLYLGILGDSMTWRIEKKKAIDFAHQANQLLDYSIFHYQTEPMKLIFI